MAESDVFLVDLFFYNSDYQNDFCISIRVDYNRLGCLGGKSVQKFWEDPGTFHNGGVFKDQIELGIRLVIGLSDRKIEVEYVVFGRESKRTQWDLRWI